MALGHKHALLLVTDSDVTLWTTGRPLPVFKMACNDERLGTHLVDALLRLHVVTAQVLLDITDIHLQVETLPKAGLFDQAKVAARRSHFLYPTAELRKALRLGESNNGTMLDYLFVAVPNHAQLAVIYNSLARAQVWLRQVLLLPVEFWGLLWPAERRDDKQRDFVLLHNESHVRLLALENNVLQLTRTLSVAAVSRPELLQQELLTTQSYMLRKGWQKDSPWYLSTFGMPNMPPDFAQQAGGRWRFVEPTQNATQRLIGLLLDGRKPLCPLQSPRMRQRQWLLRTNHWVRRALQAAAVITLLLGGLGTAQLWQANYKRQQAQAALDAMPHYNQEAGRDWARLEFWQTQNSTPMPLLTTLASKLAPQSYLQSLQWSSSLPEQNIPNYDLTLRIKALPYDAVGPLSAALGQKFNATVREETGSSGQQSGVLGDASGSDNNSFENNAQQNAITLRISGQRLVQGIPNGNTHEP